MHSGRLEGVADGGAGVQDSDKTVQNLTDCTDKISMGLGLRKEIHEAAHSLSSGFPLVRFRDRKKKKSERSRTA
jgi:hypothetical protein